MKKTIEEIEDALTPRDDKWALQKMKEGHTVAPGPAEFYALGVPHYKMVRGIIKYKNRPEEKWIMSSLQDQWHWDQDTAKTWEIVACRGLKKLKKH